jgi:hypothetical protein
MSEVYDHPTEIERFEERLDSRIDRLEELLDRLDSCIYETQEKTVENITSQLASPFTKGEGMLLFL